MPVIWWGTKKVTNPQGYVADFCSICRDVAPMEIFRVGLASHLYGIAYGKDETLNHTAQCQSCRSLLPTDLARYLSVSDLPDSLQGLVRRTNPRVYERYKDRLELERTIAEKPEQVPRLARGNLIAEKFCAVETEVRERLSNGRFDQEFLTCLLGYVGIAVFVIPRLIDDLPLRGRIEVALMVPSACLLFFLWATSYTRYLHKHVYPKLSAALRPLKPTELELKVQLRHLAQRQLTIASVVKPQELKRWLARRH